ncbi:predicted protein [Nematostella vectensis]|uniref:G-protein coupled receptors family 1 profile domain-containing protein n=1 Tax=Nematostella vectensis TaxID=45351 RepID=A7RSG0_NEMVE|nr:neuropeptide FF receptor 2 [Nematostella vectensis]EDO45630.1 predicted protein [Nematostella vectensis]|eukprot:XP_001637693.1 predicted protein [Nematostella vectensis]
MNNTSTVLIPRIVRSNLLSQETELAIYYLTLFIGVTGNFLVFLSIAMRGLRLVRPNDIFILNLAASDLLMLVVFIPFSIHIRVAVFNPSVFICKCMAPVITVALGGAVFTLTVMALHRWQMIVNPFQRDITNRTACILVSGIWVLSLALAVPKILFATPWEYKRICIIRWPSKDYVSAYTVALFVIRFVIPFTLIVFSYVRMGISLSRTHAPRFRKDSRGNILNLTNRRENFEVIRTLTVIVVLFFVCMFPYRVSLLLQMFGHSKNVIVSQVYRASALATVFHSCVNPLIYCAVLSRFRDDFFRIGKFIFCMGGCRRKANRPLAGEGMKILQSAESDGSGDTLQQTTSI